MNSYNRIVVDIRHSCIQHNRTHALMDIRTCRNPCAEIDELPYAISGKMLDSSHQELPIGPRDRSAMWNDRKCSFRRFSIGRIIFLAAEIVVIHPRWRWNANVNIRRYVLAESSSSVQPPSVTAQRQGASLAKAPPGPPPQRSPLALPRRADQAKTRPPCEQDCVRVVAAILTRITERHGTL